MSVTRDVPPPRATFLFVVTAAAVVPPPEATSISAACVPPGNAPPACTRRLVSIGRALRSLLTFCRVRLLSNRSEVSTAPSRTRLKDTLHGKEKIMKGCLVLTERSPAPDSRLREPSNETSLLDGNAVRGIWNFQRAVKRPSVKKRSRELPRLYKQLTTEDDLPLETTQGTATPVPTAETLQPEENPKTRRRRETRKKTPANADEAIRNRRIRCFPSAPKECGILSIHGSIDEKPPETLVQTLS